MTIDTGEILAAKIRTVLGGYDDPQKSVSQCVQSVLDALAAQQAEIEQWKYATASVSEKLGRADGERCALRTELEALRAMVPKWIPVTERLPKPWADAVLTFPFREDDLLGIWGKRKNDTEYQWLTQDRDGYYWPILVTHWMPLPPPPTESKGNERQR